MTELAGAADIHYLTSENAVFYRTPGGMLALTAGGVSHQPVYLHLSFPHTDARRWISASRALRAS